MSTPIPVHLLGVRKRDLLGARAFIDQFHDQKTISLRVAKQVRFEEMNQASVTLDPTLNRIAVEGEIGTQEHIRRLINDGKRRC